MNILRREHDLLVLENCTLGMSSSFSGVADRFKLSIFSGILEGGNKYYNFSDRAPKIFLNKVVKDSGQWFGVFESGDDKVICSDFYGYATLFYSYIPVGAGKGTLIVSDSFRAVASYRYKLGLTGVINWEVVLPHLISNTNLFLTRASNKTFHNDIYTLNYDEVMYVQKETVTIVNRKCFYKKFSLGYEQLLDQGIQKAVKNFEQSIKSDKAVLLNLSGGKDSRVVLSILLKSKYRDKLKVMTANPFSLPAGASKDILLQDFYLAAKIAKKYKLNWYSRTDFEAYKLNYPEQLAVWQDFRSNSSFEMKVKSNQLKSCKELRITGIGGELVRSYLGNSYKDNFPQLWEKIEANEYSLSESLEALFRSLCHPWLIDNELYESAKKNFINSFSFNQSYSLIDQLDESYLSYRNRAHSGVRSVHAFEGAILHYPLAQVEFFEASLLLSKEERDQGKVLFDIIKRTTPELNYLPFASPAWPESFMDPTIEKKLGLEWQSVNADQKITEFKKLYEKKNNRTTFDRGVEDFDVHSEGIKRLSRNLDIINEVASGSINFRAIVERVARLQQKNTNALNSLVAKTESMVDVILPGSVQSHIMNIDLDRKVRVYKYHTVNDSESLGSVISRIDLSEVAVKLSYNPSSNKLDILYSNVPENCLIAVYIYLNGERKVIDWYEIRTNITIDIQAVESDNIRVMSFIKRDGEPEAQRVIDEEISISMA